MGLDLEALKKKLIYGPLEPVESQALIDELAEARQFRAEWEEKKSQTWPYVLAFARRMEAKLEKNRHKGNREGWLGDAPETLLGRLREEVRELELALMPGLGGMNPIQLEQLNRGDIAERRANEAADVANFAMMIADTCGGVQPARLQSGRYVPDEVLEKVKDAMEEAVDLFEDAAIGDYVPDSFTPQPLRAALAALEGVKP